MIYGLEAVLLSSENAQRLADFYKDTVGLSTANEFEMGEDGTRGFEFSFGEGKTSLYIIDHSEVKGKSKEAPRVMINFEVDDAEREVERLNKAGVKVVKDLYHVEGYGLVATFEDLDGNFFQFVQVRPVTN